MTINRYFRAGYHQHSKTTAYLLALLSYYVYEDEVPGAGCEPPLIYWTKG